MPTPRSPRPPSQPLPFDDEADRPIGLALTARARRVVAPEELPELRVVDAGAPSTPDPSDTRPSRARALRRAGRSLSDIARSLQVDELLVRAWVADVSAAGRRRRGRTPAAGPSESPTIPVASRPAASAHRTAGGAASDEVDDRRTAFELARAAAADQARCERLGDPDFTGGLGLLVGLAEIDLHAVTVTTAQPPLAEALLRWLRRHLDLDPQRVRLVLRIGPRVAGDLAAHRWARQLGLPRERVAVAIWRDAPSDDAEAVLVRVADPTVAATVAGWRDALLAPPGSDDLDLAF